MTRIQALEHLILTAMIVEDDDGETAIAADIMQEMLEEVLKQPTILHHAVEELHRLGAVPLVWGDSRELTSDTPAPDLLTASRRLTDVWTKLVSDHLESEVQATLTAAYAAA